MSELEKIARYIELTGHKESIPYARYQMRFCECKELAVLARETTLEAIALAFDYGFAKGYRARKAHEQKGGANDGKAQS